MVLDLGAGIRMPRNAPSRAQRVWVYIVGWFETLAAALVTGDGRLPRRWESSLRAVDVWDVCRRLRDFEIEIDIEAHAKRAIHENDSDIGNSDVEIVGSPDDVDWDGNNDYDDDDDA